MFLPAQIPGGSHAGRRGNGRAGMARIKDIVTALLRLGKAAETAHLAERVKVPCPPCQNLVNIGLVSHIPDDLILRTVKDPIIPQKKM